MKTTIAGRLRARMDAVWQGNIRQLDTDVLFLRPFQERQRKGGYIGLGKHLCALVQLAHHSGEAEVIAFKDRLVRATIEAQDDRGYIGAIAPASPFNRLWKTQELSHVIWALTLEARYFRNAAARAAAQKAAQGLIAAMPPGGVRTDPSGYWAKTGNTDVCPELTYIDFERALLELYRDDPDERYLDAVRRMGLADWTLQIELGRRNKLFGHVYAVISRCVSQLMLHEITGDDRLLASSRTALEFLLQRGGLAITGAAGHWECWHNNQRLDGELGETCATAYLIDWLEHFYAVEGKTLYLDLIERMIYNALLAAQSPEGRHIRYYTPIEGRRVWYDRDTYCCPTNFRWIMTRMPELVYRHHAGGILVNLFESSTMETRLASGQRVAIEQQTRFPADGAVRLVLGLDAPTRFRLHIRQPAWCRGASLSVGNQPVDAPVQDGLIMLDREFRPGEEISLQLPMDWRLVKGFRQQFGRVAAMRGPVVFSVDTGKLTDVRNHRELVLVPGSIGPLQTTEPMTCEAKGVACGKPVTIPLQEFAVPTGTATYLFPADSASAEDDELLDTRAIVSDPDRRRVSGVIPEGLDVDEPGAEWDGTCAVQSKQWDGQ